MASSANVKVEACSTKFCRSRMVCAFDRHVPKPMTQRLPDRLGDSKVVDTYIKTYPAALSNFFSLLRQRLSAVVSPANCAVKNPFVFISPAARISPEFPTMAARVDPPSPAVAAHLAGLQLSVSTHVVCYHCFNTWIEQASQDRIAIGTAPNCHYPGGGKKSCDECIRKKKVCEPVSRVTVGYRFVNRSLMIRRFPKG